MFKQRIFKSDKNLLRALKHFEGPIVHLTHTDLDAVCSDALHRRKYVNVFTIFSPVRYYACYLDSLAKFEPRRTITLSLSDLGGTPGITEALMTLVDRGWKIEWRDHHVWDSGLFDDVKQMINYLRVDERYCACEIVYQDLLPNDEIARNIAFIGRDRDFWINEDPRSEILSTVIDTSNWKTKISDKLSKGIAVDNEVTREYDLAVKRKNEALKRSLKSSRLFDGVAVARGLGFSSDLASALRNKHNTKIEVIINDNGSFSIRSVEPVSNKIAGYFGGGGHPNAAGGTLHFNFSDKVIFRLLPFRQQKVKNLLKIALNFA